MGAKPKPEPKVCVACGRTIEWRRKWANNWDDVKYCGSACRKRGVKTSDESLETEILRLLDARDPGKTICPSEAARAVFPDDWQGRMEDARRAARRLVDKGEIEITQSGRAVDPSTARGPIRLRRVTPPSR